MKCWWFSAPTSARHGRRSDGVSWPQSRQVRGPPPLHHTPLSGVSERGGGEQGTMPPTHLSQGQSIVWVYLPWSMKPTHESAQFKHSVHGEKNSGGGANPHWIRHWCGYVLYNSFVLKSIDGDNTGNNHRLPPPLSRADLCCINIMYSWVEWKNHDKFSKHFSKNKCPPLFFASDITVFYDRDKTVG